MTTKIEKIIFFLFAILLGKNIIDDDLQKKK